MRRPPTGGGPPPKEPKTAEQLLLNMIGDTPGLGGIPGGIDSTEIQLDQSIIVFVDDDEDPSGFRESLSTPATPSTSAGIAHPPIKCEAPSDSKILFPAPLAPRIRKPRADKVASDLHLDVLALENQRIQEEIKLIKKQQCHGDEKHQLEMEVLRLQKMYYLSKMGLQEE